MYMAVSFINAMRVPEQDVDYFERMWREGAEYVEKQPGFISTSLHKTVALNDEFQYYTVAVWRTPADLRNATSTAWWKAFTDRFGFNGPDPRFSSVPAICEIRNDPQNKF